MNKICPKSPTGRHVFGQGFNIANSESYLWCIHCERRWSKALVSEIINLADALSVELAEYKKHFGHFMDQRRANPETDNPMSDCIVEADEAIATLQAKTHAADVLSGLLRDVRYADGFSYLDEDVADNVIEAVDDPLEYARRLQKGE